MDEGGPGEASDLDLKRLGRGDRPGPRRRCIPRRRPALRSTPAPRLSNIIQTVNLSSAAAGTAANTCAGASAPARASEPRRSRARASAGGRRAGRAGGTAGGEGWGRRATGKVGRGCGGEGWGGAAAGAPRTCLRYPSGSTICRRRRRRRAVTAARRVGPGFGYLAGGERAERRSPPAGAALAGLHMHRRLGSQLLLRPSSPLVKRLRPSRQTSASPAPPRGRPGPQPRRINLTAASLAAHKPRRSLAAVMTRKSNPSHVSRPSHVSCPSHISRPSPVRRAQRSPLCARATRRSRAAASRVRACPPQPSTDSAMKHPAPSPAPPPLRAQAPPDKSAPAIYCTGRRPAAAGIWARAGGGGRAAQRVGWWLWVGCCGPARKISCISARGFHHGSVGGACRLAAPQNILHRCQSLRAAAAVSPSSRHVPLAPPAAARPRGGTALSSARQVSSASPAWEGPPRRRGLDPGGHVDTARSATRS